jgi:DNA primase
MVLPRGSKLPLFPLTKLEPIQGRVLLVEGIFDVLNLRQYGLNNTITGFGIKNFKDRLNILSILGVTGIDICFDPDEPGQNAAEEVKDVAEELGFDVRNVKLKNNDPGALREESVANLKAKLYG